MGPESLQKGENILPLCLQALLDTYTYQHHSVQEERVVRGGWNILPQDDKQLSEAILGINRKKTA